MGDTIQLRSNTTVLDGNIAIVLPWTNHSLSADQKVCQWTNYSLKRVYYPGDSRACEPGVMPLFDLPIKRSPRLQMIEYGISVPVNAYFRINPPNTRLVNSINSRLHQDTSGCLTHNNSHINV